MLQKFGLELRKVGSLKNLYKDVDSVLSNYNIKSGEINSVIQSSSVANSLQKMLSADRWICVITIKQCAELCNICIIPERMKVYSAQHCIHWSEMLPDFRQIIIAMILYDFRSILNPIEDLIIV